MKKQIMVTMALAVLVALASCVSTNTQTNQTTQTTHLFEAVEAGTPQDVQAAIDQGADVNARDLGGFTPLMYASGQQNAQVIARLLKAGANVNAQDPFGMTPLMDAAVWTETPEAVTVNMLLAAGADGKVKDKKGKTAFDYALENWRLKGTDALKKLEEASK